MRLIQSLVCKLLFKWISFHIKGKNEQFVKKIRWNELSLSHLGPRTKECELEVKKIIYIQSLAEQLLNTFIDPKNVTKSHRQTTNTSIKINVPTRQANGINDSKACMKRLLVII